jgi:REP element-mobilizing transposase RayT
MPQSLANILIHVIWSTKDRRPLIKDDVRAVLHGYMAGILKNIESPALIINSVSDHVHMLCQLSKNIAACKLVEEVKKSSSKWMKERGVGDFAWQNGYGVFFTSANPTWIQCVNTSPGRQNIISSEISKTSSASSVKDTTWQLTSAMCGIDFVTPFQGLNLLLGRCSQGIALGCPVLRLWRGKGRPERPELQTGMQSAIGNRQSAI